MTNNTEFISIILNNPAATAIIASFITGIITLTGIGLTIRHQNNLAKTQIDEKRRDEFKAAFEEIYRRLYIFFENCDDFYGSSFQILYIPQAFIEQHNKDNEIIEYDRILNLIVPRVDKFDKAYKNIYSNKTDLLALCELTFPEKLTNSISEIINKIFLIVIAIRKLTLAVQLKIHDAGSKKINIDTLKELNSQKIFEQHKIAEDKQNEYENQLKKIIRTVTIETS